MGVYHKFYKETIKDRITTLNDKIKSFEDALIDDFVSYLNETFDARVKTF